MSRGKRRIGVTAPVSQVNMILRPAPFLEPRG